MEESLLYLKKKHKEVKRSYSKNSCTLIAKKIAKLLLGEGRKPYILSYQKEDDELYPVMYKFGWGFHVVCCYDNMVYDPILEKPIPIRKYPLKAFREEITPKLIYSSKNIDEFVNN